MPLAETHPRRRTRRHHEIRTLGPRSQMPSDLEEHRATITGPGLQSPLDRYPNRPRRTNQDDLDRVQQCRNRSRPTPSLGLGHEKHPFKIDPEFGGRKQPEARQPHHRHPRAGASDRPYQGQRQAGGSRAIGGHRAPPLEATMGQKIGKRLRNGQGALVGPGQGTDPITQQAEGSEVWGGNRHLPSIEHLFDTGN